MDEQKKKRPGQMNELQTRMRQWRQENPKATFTEIEKAVDKEMARVRQVLLTELASENQSGGAQECPECGQKMVRNGRKKRQLRTKDNEVVKLEREQWRCLKCGMTLFPPG